MKKIRTVTSLFVAGSFAIALTGFSQAYEPLRANEPSIKKPGAKLTPEAQIIVAIMKKSLTTNPLQEFKFADVTDWKADKPKKYNGRVYETGVLIYDAQTIFGIRKIKARAYIKGNKVKVWTFDKTNMPIR